MSQNIKCLSVKLESLVRISDKAYSAKAFDGSEAIIPISQIFGQDFGVNKSDAYWISEWILRKKSIQYNNKKEAWFDSETRKMISAYTIEKHKPSRMDLVKDNSIKSLKNKSWKF